MFSGKSEELIRRVTRYQIARVPVQTSSELLRRVEDSTQVIGIDEGQFFDEELVDIVEQLAAAGKQVIVAGLDTDFLRRPFEPIPTLCHRAEYVTKMLAVCHKCGGPGMYTQRIVRSDDLVVLGAQDAYEARCRVCYDPTEPEQPKLDLVAG